MKTVPPLAMVRRSSLAPPREAAAPFVGRADLPASAKAMAGLAEARNIRRATVGRSAHCRECLYVEPTFRSAGVSRAGPSLLQRTKLDGAGNRIYRPMAARRKRAPLRLTSPRPHASDAVAGHRVRRAARDGSPNQPCPASHFGVALFVRRTDLQVGLCREPGQACFSEKLDGILLHRKDAVTRGFWSPKEELSVSATPR